MHTFAVVHVPRGVQVPPHVEDLLRSTQPVDLAFRSEGHLHWSSDDRTAQFGGWHAGGEHLGRGSYHDVRPSGLTAFAGSLWVDSQPWEQWVPWASQLADRLDAVHGPPAAGVRTVLSRSNGCFSMVRLGPDGRGAIGSDALGLHLLYTATVGDLTVVSNRAALAARIVAPAGTRPARDVESAAWMAFVGSVFDDRSTFRDVRVLPVGATVEFSPTDGPEVNPGDSTPWLDRSARLDPLDPASYGAAVEDLRANLRLIMSVQAWKHDLELTGGRDSRMVLALLLAEERAHDVFHLTWGAPDLPDVVVANMLADRFDLDLDAEGRRPGRRSARSEGADAPPSPTLDVDAQEPAATLLDERGDAEPAVTPAPEPPPDDPPPLPDLPSGHYDALIRRHLWLTSGAVSIWDAYDRARLPKPHISITGLCGEMLRTNYPMSNEVRTLEQLAGFLDAGLLGHDRAALFRPDAHQHLRSRVDADLHALFDHGGDARDAIDGYYQIGRFRRWFGAGNELDDRNRMLPLYSLTAFRTAFSIGAEHRRTERLPFQLMAATAPELTTMPFAGRNWSPRLIGTLPDPDRYPITPDPVPPTFGGRSRSSSASRRLWGRRPRSAPRRTMTTVVDQRQDREAESRSALLSSYLDLGPGHPLYEFLDHDATMRAVNDLSGLDVPARKAVFAAATAAMWLTEADMPLY